LKNSPPLKEKPILFCIFNLALPAALLTNGL
jgi:hypothetical protein